jgi:hypothetical protein
LLHPGSGSRILGVKKHRIPDPTSFFIKAINKFCLLIPDPDPTIAPSRIRIPDPGGKKAPDPGSGSATLFQSNADANPYTMYIVLYTFQKKFGSGSGVVTIYKIFLKCYFSY